MGSHWFGWVLCPRCSPSILPKGHLRKGCLSTSKSFSIPENGFFSLQTHAAGSGCVALLSVLVSGEVLQAKFPWHAWQLSESFGGELMRMVARLDQHPTP